MPYYRDDDHDAPDDIWQDWTATRLHQEFGTDLPVGAAQNDRADALALGLTCLGRDAAKTDLAAIVTNLENPGPGDCFDVLTQHICNHDRAMLDSDPMLDGAPVWVTWANRINPADLPVVLQRFANGGATLTHHPAASPALAQAVGPFVVMRERAELQASLADADTPNTAPPVQPARKRL